MKQNLITDVIQGMLPYLINAQSKCLQEILQDSLDTLRKNHTIDWQKRDSARARMCMMIKKLQKCSLDCIIDALIALVFVYRIW